MDAITAGLAEYYEKADTAAVEVVDPPKKRGKPTRARTQPFRIVHNERLDVERVAFSCRCWRCRAGGVAVGDMRALDQILARNLLRMGDADRDVWLREWGANPNHGPRGRQTLSIWMDIERGAKVTAPAYVAKVSYE